MTIPTKMILISSFILLMFLSLVSFSGHSVTWAVRHPLEILARYFHF